MPRVLCSPSCEAVLWYRGLGLHSEEPSAWCVSRASRSPQEPGPVPGKVHSQSLGCKRHRCTQWLAGTLSAEGGLACITSRAWGGPGGLPVSRSRGDARELCGSIDAQVALDLLQEAFHRIRRAVALPGPALHPHHTAPQKQNIVDHSKHLSSTLQEKPAIWPNDTDMDAA